MRELIKISTTWSNMLILLSLLLYFLGGIGGGLTLNFILAVSAGHTLIISLLSVIENEWHWKVYSFINRPLVKYYESREQNYKEVIAQLESQLYKSDTYESDKEFYLNSREERVKSKYANT